MSRKISHNATYSDKLVKLIPVEIVAAYLAIQDLVVTKPAIREIALYSSAAVLSILIPFYLRLLHGVTSWLQIGVTIVSFLVWAFSASVLFLEHFSFDPVWGTIVLILWTTMIPILQFKEVGKEVPA